MSAETRSIVRATLTIAGVGAAFWMLYALRGAGMLLFAAIVIGAATRPIVERLQRGEVSRVALAAALYMGLGGLIAGALALLAPLVADQLALLARRLPDDVAALHAALSHSHNPIELRLAARLEPLLSSSPNGGDVQQMIASALSLLYSVCRAWFSVLLAIVVSFAWTLEGKQVIRELVHLAPEPRREHVHDFIVEAEVRVGRFLRAQFVVCVISAVSLSLALTAIKLPYAFVIGATAGALEIIPLFGPMTGGLLAMTIALTSSPTLVVWAGGIAFINHLFVNYVLAPRIFGNTVGVHPFVVLLSLSAFGSLLGVEGALLAIPIAAIFQLLLDKFLLTTDHPAEPASRDKAALLEMRASELVLDARKLTRLEGALADDPLVQAAEDLAEATALDLERLLHERRASTAATP